MAKASGPCQPTRAPGLPASPLALLRPVELDSPKFGRPGVPVLLFTGDCAPRPETVGAELLVLRDARAAPTMGRSYTVNGDPTRTPREAEVQPQGESQAAMQKGGDRGDEVAVTPQLS